MNIGVFGIGIQNYEASMENIFGNDYVSCNDMSDTKENLTRIFVEKVRIFLEGRSN